MIGNRTKGVTRLSRLAIPGFLILLLILLSSIPEQSRADQTLTIDFDSTLSAAGHPIATGFTGVIADSVTDAESDTLFVPLKPSCVRGIAYWPPTEKIWERAARTGATIIINLDGTIPRGDTTDFRYVWIAHANKDSLMTAWANHVAAWANYATHHRVVNGVTVNVLFDIWNEPDLNWHPSHEFDPDSVGLFYEVWKTAVDTVREMYPGAKFTGPSFAYSVDGAGPDIWKPGPDEQRNSGVRMDGLLAYCKANNCLPQVLGWHDIGNWDYADPNLDNENYHMDSTWNLYAQVKYAKAKAKALGGGYDPEYEINEMMDRGFHVIPGVMVREFALAERARMLGLAMAGRTYWCDPGTPLCKPEDISTTSYQKLCGLVDPCYGPHYLQKRPGWWTHKAYADIAGTYVNAFSSDSLDAVSGFDPAEHKIQILAGNYAKASHGSTTVVLRHIDQSMIINGGVQVAVSRMVGSDPYEVSNPIEISNTRELVFGDSCVVDVDAGQFGPGDALSIIVARQ